MIPLNFMENVHTQSIYRSLSKKLMIVKTKFKNLFIINGKKFKDKRGHFRELLKENKVGKKFPFIDASFSNKNVIRGLHIQLKNSLTNFLRHHIHFYLLNF